MNRLFSTAKAFLLFSLLEGIGKKLQAQSLYYSPILGEKDGRILYFYAYKSSTAFSDGTQFSFLKGRRSIRSFPSLSFFRQGGFLSFDSLRLPKPEVAAFLSAIVPGMGQIYNRSFWKAPIVWVFLGTTGYLAYYHHQRYIFYRQAYKEALSGGSSVLSLPPENIRLLREGYRQDRDIFLLAFVIGYGLQIGEALAEAHLKGFVIYSWVGPSGVSLALAW
ncbi:MAG: DUF5683 domain-containing protein [Bacteroidia bacterium]|nr:DUF5683 domain-containing protein [Bacteroidia bacterium]MDW8015330.1 DUF5683 domain-containing protein [Bacteroidia bacterium]